MKPLISILLPVYNSEQYVQECLESILAQTYKNWELIIVNDGSTDNSDKIVKAFISECLNKVTYLSLEHNGLPYCLNKGVEVAAGKYIARMDADDIMLENRLELQVDFLENNANVGVLGGYTLEIDEHGVDSSMITPPIHDSEIKQALYYSCPILHPSVMIRKELLQKNLYKELYPNPEDLELFMRLEKITTFRNLETVLIKKRFHKKSITRNSRIFKIRFCKESILYAFRKRNFRNVIPLMKMLLFSLAPNAIQIIWEEFRYKQRKEIFLREYHSVR